MWDFLRSCGEVWAFIGCYLLPGWVPLSGRSSPFLRFSMIRYSQGPTAVFSLSRDNNRSFAPGIRQVSAARYPLSTRGTGRVNSCVAGLSPAGGTLKIAANPSQLRICGFLLCWLRLALIACFWALMVTLRLQFSDSP